VSAGVYENPRDAPEQGEVDVIVNYTKCVQCGAITEKGRRLTTPPPEGGDGPLYKLMSAATGLRPAAGRCEAGCASKNVATET